jgi:hypothetical protein
VQGDFCHKRSIKCCPDATGSRGCQNCNDFDVLCTFDRPLKRGRVASDHSSSVDHRSRGRDQTQSQRQRLHQYPHRQQSVVKQNDVGHIADVSAEIPPTQTNRISGLGATSGEPSTTRKQKNLNGVSIGAAWKAFAVASANMIEHLVDVYLQVVYPM